MRARDPPTEIDDAKATLSELAELLERAVEDAARRANDVRSLAEWAERRVNVQERLKVLERTAGAAIARAVRANPSAATDVRARIVHLRTLTSDLREADLRRLALVARCKETVRGFLAALNPPARAYGPGGDRTTAELPASTRRSA